MNDLIERLENATGPDMRLDAAISQTLGLSSETEQGLPCTPMYTTSIDAALTLVPTDFDYEITINGTNDEQTYTCAAVRWWRDGRVRNEGGWLHRSGNAKTTALALCIAALKARTEAERKGKGNG